jgi:hypothetical protein
MKTGRDKLAGPLNLNPANPLGIDNIPENRIPGFRMALDLPDIGIS